MTGSGDTNPTPDVVRRAKAALEGVTEGPWEWDRDELVTGSRLELNRPRVVTVNCFSEAIDVPNADDAAFIAAARSLVPELVVEVEKLRATLARLALLGGPR